MYAAVPSAGFVLVGGHSRRMGRDKGLLPLGGNILVAHIAARVKEAAGSVHLVGAREMYENLGFPTLPDRYPGFGPTGGIVTALAAPASSEWNLIVACDMPGISTDFLTALLAEAVDNGRDATVPVTPDGRRHPLCAVYRRSALFPLQAAVEDRTHRLMEALEAVSVHEYMVEETDSLVNVNSPAEWKNFQNAVQ
jgi:molybdopterin-guanine dinucleotide biosynthesis protein A